MEGIVAARYARMRDSLNERARRLFVAGEAMALGHGGVALVSRATGVAASTIGAGIAEIRAAESGSGLNLDRDRSRREGGGRKKTVDIDPTLVPDLKRLVEESTRGDPESRLLWTARSQRVLVRELTELGHRTSMKMVSRLLKEMDYSLQGNRKRLEGTEHPDRDAQFRNINEKVRLQIASGNPVLSVDTKKKELVGNYKNGGRELRPKGQPEDVKVHDFADKELGKASPYGVFDIGKNEAWVSVGISHDTAEFSVNAVRSWWGTMGQAAYPNAMSILITADCGGSNGYRLRLWKVELQKLVDEIGIPISLSHLPPGTSKWNKVEHKVFSFITQNWRGKPLVTHKVIVSLIAATTTTTGLKVQCRLDERIYAKGLRITDGQMNEINLVPDAFHGEWNYTIKPSADRANAIE